MIWRSLTITLATITLVLIGSSPWSVAAAPNDPFAPLNSPACIRAAVDRSRQPGDLLLGAGRAGEYCAYPLREMAAHRVVNDHLGGPPILVAYDPDSDVGQVYDPLLDGRALTFIPVDGDSTLLHDRETGSTWTLASGIALGGPLRGRRLSRLPSLILTWEKWQRLHPNSWVIQTGTQPPADGGSGAAATSPRPSSRRSRDRRVPGEALVLGIETPGGARAYPMDRLPGVVQEAGIVIFSDPVSRAAAAFDPSVKARSLTFAAQDLDHERLFIDAETRSLWNIEGRAIDGPLKGSALTQLAFEQSRWYAWSAGHPHSRLYSQKRAVYPRVD